ncbi:hypothetical protein ACHAP5_006677 [Fusarium lateritium]
MTTLVCPLPIQQALTRETFAHGNPGSMDFAEIFSPLQRHLVGRFALRPPPGSKWDHDVNTTSSDPAYPEYANKAVSSPKGATLAEKTTEKSGQWYTVQAGFDCARLLFQHHISLPLFTQANPSVSEESCSQDLIPG